MRDLSLGGERVSGRSISIPAKLRYRHLYVVGKSGKGKSTFFHRLIHQDVKRPYATILFDAGDLAPDVLEALPDRLLDRVMYFTVTHPIPYNPLMRRMTDEGDELRASRLENELFALMDQVTAEGSAAMPLSPRMKRLLSAALRETLKQPTPSLSALVVFLNTQKGFLGRALDIADFSATLDAVRDRLSPFLRDPRIRRVICNGHELDFGRVLDEGRILLISLAGLEPALKRFLGTLLFHGLLATIQDRGDRANRRDAAVYVDEFHDYVTSSYAAQNFQFLFSQGRKHLVSLAVAHTDLGQIPAGLTDTMLTAPGSFVAFGCGTKEAAAMSPIFTRSKVDGTAWPAETLRFLPDFQAVGRVDDYVGAFATRPAPTKLRRIEKDTRSRPPDPPDPFALSPLHDDAQPPNEPRPGRKPRRAAAIK